MPIQRSSFRDCQLPPSLYGPNRNIEQPDHSTEQVQSVGRGKNVEETAAGIRGKINALGHQLPPCHELTDKKQKA
jgi:hypothetical protein